MNIFCVISPSYHRNTYPNQTKLRIRTKMQRHPRSPSKKTQSLGIRPSNSSNRQSIFPFPRPLPPQPRARPARVHPKSLPITHPNLMGLAVRERMWRGRWRGQACTIDSLGRRRNCSNPRGNDLCTPTRFSCRPRFLFELRIFFAGS
jgi:hypothetical protein